jgi:hypothetical protein
VAVELACAGANVSEGLVDGIQVLGESSEVTDSGGVLRAGEADVVSVSGARNLRVFCYKPAGFNDSGLGRDGYKQQLDCGSSN